MLNNTPTNLSPNNIYTQTHRTTSTHPYTNMYSMKDMESESESESDPKIKKVGAGWWCLFAFTAAVFANQYMSCFSKGDAVLAGAVAMAIALLYLDSTPRPTYLLDFACYRPPDELQISKSEFIDLAAQSGSFTDSAIEFQRQTLAESGIGDRSYMPRVVFKPNHTISLSDGREEAAAAMFGAIDVVLAATKVRAKDVGILVVNCGVLNTTPSLAAMLINHYKLGKSVQSFNLGGMGCSAGVIAVDVASHLLRVHHKATYALVVSTEAVSFTWYKGPDPDKLIPNCFVRSGASAVLLSGARRHRWRAKYRLLALNRRISGAAEAIKVDEDKAGTQGVSVGPGLVDTLLGCIPTPRPGFDYDHVCVSAMGKTVLDAMQPRLGLSDTQMEASRKTLERFGNTSSSSIWYELAYLEQQRKIKPGHRVWQITFGSGVKCNTLLWEALHKRTKPPAHSPWDH